MTEDTVRFAISLAQTVALLRHSRILVSNDSGPVHMASAVGCAVVSLFLRTQPGLNPKRWQPLGEHSIVLANPENQSIKINQQSQVISGDKSAITVDQVAEVVEQFFRKSNQENFIW